MFKMTERRGCGVGIRQCHLENDQTARPPRRRSLYRLGHKL